MDLRRVHPTENTNEVAAEQVKGLLPRLSERDSGGGSSSSSSSGGGVPLFIFDAGYDPMRLQQSLEGCQAQILVRLRAGRCF
jgi:hypothetical protein